ncbi:c-type cytochrome [Roseovarius ramblicola]|uniref:C-type cytochrome n=1 Tax=Roseovarius ramblicola TaxID=2022336 RepID=A0ABV5I5K2_9RHOB
MFTRLITTGALMLSLAAPALAEGDPEAGEKVFRKCKACHMVGEDAKNRVGPALNGVVGGPVASVEDFRYSDVFQEMAAEGAVWTEDELAAFLASPRKYAKGTKMAFAGLRKDEEIANVIAYLATFE